MTASLPAIPNRIIERSIHLIRDQKVMLDSDLASLYDVSTSAFNQAVRRNRARFPVDFMFRLTAAEWGVLRSQIVISKDRRGGRQYSPFVFTEHGVAQLAMVLKSKRATEVSKSIIRTFIRLREFALSHRELAQKISALERKFDLHDDELKAVFEALRKLLRKPERMERPVRAIGFRVE